MGRARVKVCCISSVEEARLAVECGADALGLVGDMPSGPGVLDDATVRHIALAAPPPASRFLLTSRTEGKAIAEHALACGVDTVQVVTHVEAAELSEVRRLAPHVRVVQVLHVEPFAGPLAEHPAVTLAESYAPHVHAFLLDSGRPSLPVPELGGTGRTHDWDVSAALVQRLHLPVFLAGGLTATNVQEALARVRPYGLDLCSGVREKGALNRRKLEAFMAAVEAFGRSAQA